MLQLNDGAAALGARALDARQAEWSHCDGLTRVDRRDAPRRSRRHRLGARTYSLSALQRFAACPYQFLLSAIYRLRAAEEPSRCSGSIR